MIATVLVAGALEAAIILIAVLIPLVVLRTRLEDRLLRDHFGAAAIAYQSRVGIRPLATAAILWLRGLRHRDRWQA